MIGESRKRTSKNGGCSQTTKGRGPGHSDQAASPKAGGPGSRALPKGTVGALNAIKAAKESRQDDPLALEAEGLLLQVMRGEVGGRYVGARLSAIALVLERRQGKIPQPLEVKSEVIRTVELPNGQVVSPAAAGLPDTSSN